MNWPVVAPFARLIFPSLFDWSEAVIVRSFVFASATTLLTYSDDHNPNFTNFIKETNLPFKAYSEFTKDDVLSHCELYRQISEKIWGKI